MDSRSWIRRIGTGLTLAGAVAILLPSILSARPDPRVPRRRAMNLFSAAGFLVEVNRVQCGLDNFGQVCVAFSGSPVAGGGFWPKGTPDGYIFNSGLQLAAVIDPLPGLAWSGDTVGAFFFDPRGDQQSGDPITEIFSTLNPEDAANWPSEAVVRDTAIYNEVLIGRNQVSEGDAWVRYWEGNPSQLGGRLHPMGVLVDQRAVAWNFPSGNEDILYFIFKFYNVTASDPAVYNNPDIEPELQAGIAEIGARFHSLNNIRFGITLPATGYTLRDMYAAFAMDNDIAQFDQNYSTAVLPFNVGVTYSGNFEPEVGWRFPASIFGPPFFAGAGFVGAKYLRSPVNTMGQQVGLTMFSNTTNGGNFPDAQGVNLLYRRLSGYLGGGDIACNPFGNPVTARARRLCYLAQDAADSRFYQASGPFNLAPGRSATIVVAYIHAAPVDIGTNLVGGDLAPGVPATGDIIFTTPSSVRQIDRVMGWVSQSDGNGNSQIEQDEVETVTRSFLNKALVAQEVFDNKFLLPFAPQAPQFYLVPGDNQVTVVWEPSVSEVTGDPFFAVASNPTSALYDPNFRQLDVEGYRIYRGRTSSELELVAQYDYATTTFVDYTGALVYPDADEDGKDECAPELGVVEDCPAAFTTVPPFLDSAETAIVGDVVQVPPGERRLLVDSGVVVLRADTAVTGGGSGFPALSDNVPTFVFVDRNVRNTFEYHYTVTTFDVNSVKSGPTSLESPRVTRRVTPRKVASNVVAADPVMITLIGDGGVAANVTEPTLNDDGTFSGPAAAAAPGLSGSANVFADQLLLPNYRVEIKIDSVIPDYAGATSGGTYYITRTAITPGQPSPAVSAAVFPFVGPLGEEQPNQTFTIGQSVPVNDPALAEQTGLAGLPASALVSATIETHATTFSSKDIDWHAPVDGSFFNAQDPSLNKDGGSRWFEGANETMADPTLGDLHGQLTGVTTIFRPQRPDDGSNAPVNALFRRWDQTTRHLARAADIKFYWGTTPGTIDSVVDATHHVRVPFDPQNRASYGVVADVAGASPTTPGAPDGVITYADISVGACAPGAANLGQAGCDARDYVQNATLQPVDVTGDFLSDGQGFGLYVSGEPYLFLLTGPTPQLPAAPTVWTLRSYYGLVTKGTSGYTFTAKPANAPVTGLRLVFQTGEPATYPGDANVDLSRVHTVPDPYYVANSFEVSANNKVLRFVNLPSRAVIRIYSVSGVLVAVIPHDDPSGGAEVTWNLRNRNNQFVASGVYFYHVETPAGQSRVGRFTVVNFAP